MGLIQCTLKQGRSRVRVGIRTLLQCTMIQLMKDELLPYECYNAKAVCHRDTVARLAGFCIGHIVAICFSCVQVNANAQPDWRG